MRMTMEVEPSGVRVGDEVTYVTLAGVKLTATIKVKFDVDAWTHSVDLKLADQGVVGLSEYPVLEAWDRFVPTDSSQVTITREATCANCGEAIEPCEPPSGYCTSRNRGIRHVNQALGLHACLNGDDARLPLGARWEGAAREGGTREGGTREGHARLRTLREAARELLRQIEEITEEIEDEYRERARGTGNQMSPVPPGGWFPDEPSNPDADYEDAYAREAEGRYEEEQ